MDDEARVARCSEDVATMVDDLFGAFVPDEDAFGGLLERVERRIAQELAEARDAASPLACGPGCATCCTVNVGTLAVEGAVAARYLRAALGPEAARVRGAALLRFHDRVRWLDDGERIRERLACPLLDAGARCTIHPVRPLACRSVSSLDRGDCVRAIAERAGEEEEGSGAVRMDLLQRALYEEALAAIAGRLRARGLDARTRDVTAMTGAFLADPGAIAAFAAGALLPVE